MMAPLDTPWPRPRMVIFDNNGTALDDLESVAYPSVRFIFEHYNLKPPTLQAYREEITGDFMQFYRRHGFAGAFPHVTGDDLNKLRKQYYREHGSKARYRPDFAPLLTYLQKKDILIGICSAEIPEVLHVMLAQHGLHKEFTPGLIVGGAWPRKTPYLARLVADAGMMPYEAVYVDDTVDGLESAKAAGLQVIGFTSGYEAPHRLRAVTPMTVQSFSELRRRL